MREILPGVIHWTAKHPNLGTEVSSYWLVPERTVLNPLLPPEGLRAFAAEPPESVLLTNRHHLRDAERFGVPILAPTVGLHEFTPEQGVRGYDDGDEPVPGVRARAVGALSDDEYALVIPRVRAVAVADGVVRFGDRPLHFVPDTFMGDDPEGVKRGLRDAFTRLAGEEDFDALLLAHGEPVVTGARDQLRAFASS
jgi:hypothetical protein